MLVLSDCKLFGQLGPLAERTMLQTSLGALRSPPYSSTAAQDMDGLRAMAQQSITEV